MIKELDNEASRVRVDAVVGKPSFQDLNPEDYELQDGEKRTYIDPRSENDPLFVEILRSLQEWVNDLLNDEDRIRVTCMREDFFDGVVLKRIVERLSASAIKLPLDEDVQAKERQKKNLTAVLARIDELLKLPPDSTP